MSDPKLNRRYRNLIDQLDKVPPATREMFLYLFAMVAAEQGIINVVRVHEDRDQHVVVMNDPVKKHEFKVNYPKNLDPEYAATAVREMERLLSDDSAGTSMDSTLFCKLYENFSCRRCRYHAERYWQICGECYFAGRPINFEKGWELKNA